MDAILVGANTVRADNPRLMVRSAERRAKRVTDGKQPTPIKVTLTTSGDLDPTAKFFTTGDGIDKIVYAPTDIEALNDVATVVPLGDAVTPERILEDLQARGVERLMVEGGTSVHTLFLQAGLVDEMHVVFAPFFVGDASGPRLVDSGAFPQGPANRMAPAEARTIGDCVLLRYLPMGGEQ